MLKTAKLILTALFISVLTAAPVMASSSNSISKRVTVKCGEPIGSEYLYGDDLEVITSGSKYRPVYLKILPQNGMDKGSVISIYIENGAFIPSIYPMPQYESGVGKSFDQMMQDYESGLSLNSVLAANLGIHTTELPYKIVNAEIDKIDIELFPVLESECDKSSNSIAVDKVYYYIPINAIAVGLGDVKITIDNNDTNISGGGTYTIAVSTEPSVYHSYAVEGGNIYCSDTGFIYKADSSVTEANIPEAIDGINVIGISSGAFDGCNYLKQLALPSGIKGVSADSLAKYEGLKSVNIDSGNKLYASSDGVVFNKDFTELIFYPNKDDSSYAIPNNVVTLGKSAFAGCKHLKSVTIPTGVTSMGKAFAGCTSLESINIPNSVVSVNNSAFYGCTGLKSVNIPNSVASIGSSAFRDCASLTGVNIPNSVASIGSSAFMDCASLTSVNIPSSVASISSSAFRGCTSLTSVNIPNSVVSVNDFAFYGCTNLTKVFIPKSVTYIGTNAFSNCPNVVMVLMGICGENLQYSISEQVLSISGAGEMNNFARDEAPWNGERTNIGKIEVCNGVTSIGSYAFCGCEYLREVSIAGSVTSIGEHAFDGCSLIKTITIPETVTSIDETAFSNINSSAVIYNYSNININTPAVVTSCSLLPGDADCDGIVTASDAAAIQQKVLSTSFELQLESFTSNFIYYCSVDGDSIITSNDAAYVLQKALNSAFELQLQGK